ncbi:class A beta-lactamase-related serine hydrolase [Nonomuraea sp. NBC_01738]|uniref:serine hydrolase n=1 Tax=Nonomuraea sp. NBC_01738 TaxID=2976003 RepID=UPI002E11EF46|nr:class A beta-lactamase-related serine hydrolase [Nonomuraea sp. NBC_01738]
MIPDFEAVFRRAGVDGVLHAVDVDTGREVSYGPDEPVVTASVFKLPLMVELARMADAGALKLTERITVTGEDRVSGPTGVSAMLDDVTMSLRDLAYLMIAVSDNTSADVLVGRVGLDNVNAMLAACGFTGTRVLHGSRVMFASLAEDCGHGWPYLDLDELRAARALDPARTNRSTPREMTRLLSMIWRDELASAELSAWMRALMGMQVWPHRLSAGFPYDDVEVSGKTGSLPTLRNEVGVVEYPDGGRYAVAVFTRAFSPAANQPRADAVIGTTAYMAVDHLRR